jgi:hypothetical protein
MSPRYQANTESGYPLPGAPQRTWRSDQAETCAVVPPSRGILLQPLVGRYVEVMKCLNTNVMSIRRAHVTRRSSDKI